MNTHFWLKTCKDIGEKVFTEFTKYNQKKESKEILKIGFGGDKTLLIDNLAEKIILNHFKSTGKRF